MSRMHRPNQPVWEQPDKETAKGPTKSLRCPKCGDSFRNLPNHLPGCEGEA